jgi:iron complex outermembrane receptor protein
MMLNTNAAAEGQKEETLVVAASRANHSITDMAQTTWVIEQAKLNSRFRAVKSSKRCWRS